MKCLIMLVGILLIFNSYEEFTCSFRQEFGEKNCFGMATLCETEFMLVQNPKMLELRSELLINKDYQKQMICRAYKSTFLDYSDPTASCQDLENTNFFSRLNKIMDENEKVESKNIFI